MLIARSAAYQTYIAVAQQYLISRHISLSATTKKPLSQHPNKNKGYKEQVVIQLTVSELNYGSKKTAQVATLVRTIKPDGQVGFWTAQISTLFLNKGMFSAPADVPIAVLITGSFIIII